MDFKEGNGFTRSRCSQIKVLHIYTLMFPWPKVIRVHVVTDYPDLPTDEPLHDEFLSKLIQLLQV